MKYAIVLIALTLMACGKSPAHDTAGSVRVVNPSRAPIGVTMRASVGYPAVFTLLDGTTRETVLNERLRVVSNDALQAGAVLSYDDIECEYKAAASSKFLYLISCSGPETLMAGDKVEVKSSVRLEVVKGGAGTTIEFSFDLQ